MSNPAVRALWDQLNDLQGRLYLSNPKQDQEQLDIIDAMGPLAPEGIDPWESKSGLSTQQAIARLKALYPKDMSGIEYA